MGDFRFGKIWSFRDRNDRGETQRLNGRESKAFSPCHLLGGELRLVQSHTLERAPHALGLVWPSQIYCLALK